jgi:hypothetical protein
MDLGKQATHHTLEDTMTHNETTATRRARELDGEDYGVNGDSRPADDGICGGR